VRIGILEADHVADRYLPIAGDYGDMFTSMLAVADPDARAVRYDVRHGELPESPHECDAWLCTGSSASVFHDEPWIHDLTRFVREVHDSRVPFVGICFGHQLLAHALGGCAERAAVWGVGALPMELVAAPAWAEPLVSSPTLLYSHQDQVTALPPGGRVLARADHCAMAMLAVDDHMLGLQAHPEFGAPYVRALLEDRVDRIGADETAAALATLDRATDERPVAAWILAFLRGR
jgi:GMP synthase-like glutamine amidotransferase